MTYNEYSLSLKNLKYDRTLISEKIKICIDEMIDKNISFEIIAQTVKISLEQLKDYYNNEWCYKNPEKYFHKTWVEWVNIFIKNENNSKTK